MEKNRNLDLRFDDKIDQDSRVRLRWSSFMLGMASMIKVQEIPW
jgi:hypothetical protein